MALLICCTRQLHLMKSRLMRIVIVVTNGVYLVYSNSCLNASPAAIISLTLPLNPGKVLIREVFSVRLAVSLSFFPPSVRKGLSAR